MQGFVDPAQDTTRISIGLEFCTQETAGDRHEERGRHALAGNIGDGNNESVLVDKEEVVKIAPHFERGLHDGKNIQIGPLAEGGKSFWQ